jgi:hypothetical protein
MKIQNNPFPFLISGKFGDVVGRVVNGKQFFSKKARPRKVKPTNAVLAARRKFSIAIRFLKPIIPILRKYDEPTQRKGFNKAISLMIRHAIHGQHPDQQIDFSQVILGEGALPNPGTCHVESPAKGLLEFDWSLEMMKRNLSKSDRIFTIAYCENQHKFRYELSGAERRERQFLMDVSCFSGQQIEVYFGFASSNGALVSTSIYAGSLNVL